MKFLVVLAVAVACASADVSHVVRDEFNAPIVRSDYQQSPEGSYQYAYETGNGISASASGTLQNQNSEYPYLQVNGAFKYPSPDGQVFEVNYVADENGFQPQGSHLPVPPPTPEAILRSLAYIAAHPPPAEGSVRVTAAAKPNFG